MQEEKAFSSTTEFPSFGDSTWTWAAVSKEKNAQAVRHFYNSWLNFVTEKDFAWVDQWNLNEAPDRKTKRCVRVFNKLHFAIFKPVI